LKTLKVLRLGFQRYEQYKENGPRIKNWVRNTLSAN
jgi:hypothetical protein